MREAIAEVLGAVGTFFMYALIAFSVQNAVLSRALGVSRLVKLVDDDAVDSLTFCLLLTAVQLISAPLAFFANQWLAGFEYRAYVRPLVLVLCSVIAFFVVLVLIITVFHLRDAKRVTAVLPMATFNCCVLGTLLITTTSSFSLAQTFGFALGSGLGYTAAVFIVTEGERRIQNDAVPETFRGLPITLIYIGVLALAVYGLTGHMITF